jgi:hypothetical protein
VLRRCLTAVVVLLVTAATADTAVAQVAFTPPTYVDTELAGGEPLALADAAHGTIVYTSHEGTTHLYRPGFTSLAPVLFQYRNQVNIWYSDNGGSSWNRVTVPGGSSTSPTQNTGFSDPDLTMDEGGRIYDTGIDLANDALFSSNDGGKTWDRGTPNCHDGDRPWLAGAEKDHVFLATDTVEGTPSHTIFQSTDGGNTCGATGVPDGGTTASGQTYGGYGKLYWDHARRQLVEPALFYDSNGNVTGIGASTWSPGAARFTPVKVTDTTLFSHFPIVSIDNAGNYYLIWDTDDRTGTQTPSACDSSKGAPLPNRIKMAVSTDGGHTWSAPSDVAAPQNARVLWPWGVAGDAGKVSVVWYQTDKVADVDCQPASVYIYEARIGNAADPASRTIATSNASGRPIHQNSICQGGTDCVASGKDRRLGDFFTNAIDQRGCEMIASGDTTQPDPNTGGARASSLPVILRQSSGPPLVGSGDCGGAAAPTGGMAGTPTCFDHTPPVTLLPPRNFKATRHGLRARGTSSDQGCAAGNGLAAGTGKVGVVLISVARTSRRGCEFLLASKKLKKPQSCNKPVLLHALGTDRWRWATHVRLPRGNYRINVRAVDVSGNSELPSSRHNFVRFRIR